MMQLLAQTENKLGTFSLTNSGFTAEFGGNPSGRLEQILSNVISVFTIFAGISFLIYFLIGAVSWVFSGGHPESLNKAKQQMSTAILGLFVTVLSYGIVFVLGRIVGLNIFNPAGIIPNILPK